MKLKVAGIICAVLVLAMGGMAYYAWISKPQVVEFYPQEGAENVASTASIWLKFSRSMDKNSINSRLVIVPAVDGTQRWEGNTLIFTPDHPWPGGVQISARLEAGGRAASWLAFAMDDHSWAFSTREAALAYLWPASGPANIYALDPETGSIQQYTQGINVLDYSDSGDGSRLYFSASNSTGGADLYQIDLLKTGSSQDIPYQPVKLLECGEEQCRNPVASPDGNSLAYEYLPQSATGGIGHVQVWALNLSDLKTEPAGQPDHSTGLPAWSPNNLLAYYDYTSSGYEVLNPMTDERTLLTNQTGQPGSWSLDGKFFLAPEISYQQANQNYEIGNSHLIRYHILDKSSDDLSGNEAVEDVEPVYSPDGKSIAFTRKYLDAKNWTLGRQIWTMGADGLNPHAITNEADYNHYDLAWNQDASQLAYVRFNQQSIANPPELWMVKPDGSDAVQLVIGGYSPLWIP